MNCTKVFYAFPLSTANLHSSPDEKGLRLSATFNDDVIFYLHFTTSLQKFAAAILKPVIEVTSTCCVYENFRPYDSSDSEICDLRSFLNSVTHVLKNLHMQNLHTETGARTFVNSSPG